MIRAGFCANEITPALGSIIPGDFGARYNVRVQEKLYVRAAVFELDDADTQKVAAIVSIDACGVYYSLTRRVRERVAQYVPIDPDAIMICATHCHGGGPTLNWGEEVVCNETYLTFLAERAADAVICAYNDRKEACLNWGEEVLEGFSFIRIWRMKDGSLKTNPGKGNPNIVEPASPIDRSVGVIAVCVDGKPVGAVVNFACHPAIVATDVTSSDYIYHLARGLQEQYGPDFVTVFINGACGNINHFNPRDPETYKNGRHILLGRALAEKCVSAIEKASPMGEAIAWQEAKLCARLRKPTPERLAEAYALFQSYGDELINSKPGTKNYIETFFALQAMHAAKDKRTRVVLPMQVLRIGDVQIFGSPCQIFVEFGMRIKAGARTAHAMVSAFANDYGGYVPMPEMMIPGVYEARLATSSQLAPEAGDELVACFERMAEKVK